MGRRLVIVVEERTGTVGTTGPCWFAREVFGTDTDSGGGGYGATPLEAIAEVFRHMGKTLSADESEWETCRKYGK